MLLVSLFSWWYGVGYRDQIGLCGARLSRVSDRFSIALLLRNFFSPFRQISAGQVSGSLDVRMRALVDKIVARGIGAMIRSALIITGGLALLLEVVIGAIRLLVWPFLPVLPFLGPILVLSGWIPWQL